MKNRIYYLGLLTVLVIVAGCLFKVMHLAGAGILLTVGMLGFAFIFVPMAIASLYRAEENQRQRIFYLLTGIVLAVDAIGVLFKIMHWPGAGTILVITLPLPFVVLLPYFMLMNPNEKIINYKNFLAILFFFAYDAAVASLLATSVSTSITEGYIRSAMDLQKKSGVMHEFAREKTALNGKETTSHTLSDSLTLNLASKADAVCHTIDVLRNDMIDRFSGNPEEVHKTDLTAIMQRDARVDADTAKLKDLDRGLVSYAALLEGSYFCSSNLKTYAKNTFSSGGITGEGNYFSDIILVAALEELNLLEYQVRLAEWEAIVGLAIQ